MVTTTVCDAGRHAECPGEGLIQGALRPPHEPHDPGRQVWVTVRCGCSCHGALRETARHTARETPETTL